MGLFSDILEANYHEDYMVVGYNTSGRPVAKSKRFRVKAHADEYTKELSKEDKTVINTQLLNSPHTDKTFQLVKQGKTVVGDKNIWFNLSKHTKTSTLFKNAGKIRWMDLVEPKK